MSPLFTSNNAHNTPNLYDENLPVKAGGFFVLGHIV